MKMKNHHSAAACETPPLLYNNYIISNSCQPVGAAQPYVWVWGQTKESRFIGEYVTGGTFWWRRRVRRSFKQERKQRFDPFLLFPHAAGLSLDLRDRKLDMCFTHSERWAGERSPSKETWKEPSACGDLLLLTLKAARVTAVYCSNSLFWMFGLP